MPIAQVNIAKCKFAMDDPRMSGFTNGLDEINALGDASEGFIWRLKDESGHATNIILYPDPQIIFNMSVWKSLEDLFKYAYSSRHKDFLKNRWTWFEPMNKPHMCLWYVPTGYIPTKDQGKDKLELYNIMGAGVAVFDFKTASKFLN